MHTLCFNSYLFTLTCSAETELALYGSRMSLLCQHFKGRYSVTRSEGVWRQERWRPDGGGGRRRSPLGFFFALASKPLWSAPRRVKTHRIRKELAREWARPSTAQHQFPGQLCSYPSSEQFRAFTWEVFVVVLIAFLFNALSPHSHDFSDKKWP